MKGVFHWVCQETMPEIAGLESRFFTMASDNNSTEKLITLNPGMYLVRFNGPPAQQESARLGITANAKPGQLVFMPSDGVEDLTLKQIGDMIVVRCRGDNGRLGVVSSVPIDTDPVGVRIERLGAAKAGKTAGLKGATNQTSGPRGLALSGCLEGEGDVAVAAGQWLGDPAGSARLEGFAIHWEEKPDTVDLAYACTIDRLGRTSSILSGEYCGTRGRSAPIYALNLSLLGEGAASVELLAEAVFAGCPSQVLKAGVEARGLTGAEPLVALRVSIRSIFL